MQNSPITSFILLFPHEWSTRRWVKGMERRNAEEVTRKQSLEVAAVTDNRGGGPEDIQSSDGVALIDTVNIGDNVRYRKLEVVFELKAKELRLIGGLE